MPEATPIQLVEAAASAGFDFGGMWMEPADWTMETTRAVARRLRDTGLRLLDIEVVWIKPGPLDPDHIRIVQVGAELGAQNVLCVSSDPDRAATTDKIAQLALRGQASGIGINLEFGLFTEVKSLAEATSIVAEINSPALGILVDALHWTRSGGTVEEVAALPRQWIRYVQLCDAPMPGAMPDDPSAILTEAIDGRMPLGHGGLPLNALIDVLPVEITFAIEERSAALRAQYQDLNSRAAECLATSRAFLEQYQ
jgi:sugar phosphate isomerase/epimerase